jgi:predicted porin
MNLKIMGAASALAVGLALYGYNEPAFAADLGGNCCSDLEERVAELEATTARKGNRKVSLAISGQVTTGVLWFDNGDTSDTYVVDAGSQSSRFRLTGSAKINPNLSAGFNIEVGTLSATANTVTETNDDGDQGTGDGALSVRLANWYLEDKRYGRLTVGRLNMVTDGIAEIDLGGANIVAQSGLYFGNKIAVNGAGGLTFGDFFPANGDAEFDRNNAVRYDSPTFSGFTIGTSWGEDDRWDVGLRYAGEHAGFRIAGGIAYAVDSDNPLRADGDEATIVTGSLSVLHVATGLFISGTGASRNLDLPTSRDSTYWSVRGGITKNWFGIGNTVLYGEYHSSDVDNRGTAEIAGAGVVQNIDAASMELFLAYKNHSVDLDSGAPTDDTHLVISGARIRF